MDSVKAGLFRAAYFLYTNTSAGYYYHAHNLATAERKFGSTPEGAHCAQKQFTYGNISVHVIPFCCDNYSYILVDEISRAAIIVDPGDASPVLNFFTSHPTLKVSQFFFVVAKK